MPSLGMITVNALAAADSVMIPVQAQYLPAKGMTQLVQTIGKVQRTLNPDLRIDGKMCIRDRDKGAGYVTEKQVSIRGFMETQI